ncbi:HAD hydrolase-like protein [Saccharopolyspora tripterygii]
MTGISAARGREAPVVLFDWNGTVVDDIERAALAAAAVLRSRRLPAPGVREFAARFTLPLEQLFRELGVNESQVASATNQWNEFMLASPAPLQHGAKGLLDFLVQHGSLVGVVSAASTELVLSDLARLQLAEHLELVCGGAGDKAIVLRQFTAHRRSRRVFYVGDTEHDVQAARRAGAIAVGFAGGYRPAPALSRAGADHVIHGLAELIDVLTTSGEKTP